MADKNKQNDESWCGKRKFYDIPDTFIRSLSMSDDKERPVDCKSLLEYIESNCLGKDVTFTGPFGNRQVVYCDYVASGRSLKFLEEYITNNVLTYYGNTHTTTSITSLQTTLYRHEARTIIRNTVNASEHDAVVFVGSGSTAAVHKLIHALNLETPPVVFVGPFEHHSIILPWKEIGSKIVWIREKNDGSIDLDHLEEQLKLYSKQDRQLIGCLSAASNITGILTDTNKVTACLHRYGALAFWDYATAGPYTEININPVVTSDDQSLVYKDAVFLSTHKFIGGVGTPGILIAKKRLFENTVPSGCGGGSVFFVTHDSHRYLKEVEMREEGGTPAIVESIRAGLVFQLKQAVGHENIMQIENEFLGLARDVFSKSKNLIILGNLNCPRLPIFSFLIRHNESGLFLHHNFVTALLNDLFGIQSRGGCACAGPYAQDLMGIDEVLAKEIEYALLEDSRLDRTHLRRYREYSERELIRPGFTRINLPYFMKKETALFILESIVMVAEFGWKLLPKYTFNNETGEWRHQQHQVFKDRRWLGSISYSSGTMKYTDPGRTTSFTNDQNLSVKDCLIKAKEIFDKATIIKGKNKPTDQSLLLGDAEKLRWFLLPSEAALFLRGEAVQAPCKRASFTPLHRCYHGKHISDHIQTISYNKDIPKVSGESKTMITNLNSSNDYETNDTGTYDTTTTVNDDDGNINLARNISNEMEDVSCSSDTYDTTTTVNDASTSSDDNINLARNISNKMEDVSCSSDTLENGKASCDQNKVIDKNSSDILDNTQHNNRQKRKLKFHNPPRHLFNLVIKAIEEFEMIKNGDRILVCLSGGKDSLSMLHVMHQYQFYAKTKGINFTFGAATVDPGSTAYDPSPLILYMKELGVEYFYEVQGIIKQASELSVCESICSFCSRMKRGRLYACARRNGYNVLSIGQHLDDIAESFMMSVFHNGLLRTMKANYYVSENDLRVIRPLTYVREKDLRDFAEKTKLPVIAENCPACFEAPKERHRVKQLLATQELLFPCLFKSIMSAVKPLMARKQTDIENKESCMEDLSFLCR